MFTWLRKVSSGLGPQFFSAKILRGAVFARAGVFRGKRGLIERMQGSEGGGENGGDEEEGGGGGKTHRESWHFAGDCGVGPF